MGRKADSSVAIVKGQVTCGKMLEGGGPVILRGGL